METHGPLSLKLHSTLSSCYPRSLDKKGQNWTCYSYICIDLNTLHTSSTVRWKNNTGSSTLPAQPHLPDRGTGPGAGRGLGCPMSATQKPPLATLRPQLSPSPHSRQPEYRLQGEWRHAEKGYPTFLPAKTGISPLIRWTQFPSHHRAGLDEGDVQIYLAGGSNQLPLRLPGLSHSPGGKLYQQVCIERSLES